MDLSDITLPDSSAAGSRLLSESALFPTGSQDNTGDLLLSDLSINDHPRQNIGGVHRRPFSLLAQPQHRKPLYNPNANDSLILDEGEEEQQEGDDGGQGGLDQTMTQEDIEEIGRAHV